MGAAYASVEKVQKCCFYSKYIYLTNNVSFLRKRFDIQQ